MNLAGPTFLALFARVVACLALALVVALAVRLFRRSLWLALVFVLVTGLAYVSVWIQLRDDLDRRWFFLQADARRSYGEYRTLTWIEAFLPGCHEKERDVFRQIARRDVDPEAKFDVPLIQGAYFAMLEKPDARRVLLVGQDAEYYRGYFENAGLDCRTPAEAGPETTFDIVFAAPHEDWAYAGERLGKGDWQRLAARLTPSGVLAWALDVRLVSPGRFRHLLEAFPCPEAHLWMPGASDWVLTGRPVPRRIKLDAALELFLNERQAQDLADAQCATLPDLFASYVGSRAEIEPALAGVESVGDWAHGWSAPHLAFREEGEHFRVRPEFLMSEDMPKIDWIVNGQVDDDICTRVMGDVERNLRVRRKVVLGDAASRRGEEQAVETWREAAAENPRDSMLLARIAVINAQATSLLKFANPAGAAKCYETLLTIRPDDGVAMANYSYCLKRLGKHELAEQALTRAKELLK